jgi:hypothetical protein
MDNRARKLTPPEIARRYGIHPDKVLGWIRRGELRAVNVAANPRGRPRWRIDPIDLEAFEQRRSAQPAPALQRRRRQAAGDVIEFF